MLSHMGFALLVLKRGSINPKFTAVENRPDVKVAQRHQGEGNRAAEQSLGIEIILGKDENRNLYVLQHWLTAGHIPIDRLHQGVGDGVDLAYTIRCHSPEFCLPHSMVGTTVR